MEQEIIERNKVIFDFMGCKHSNDELIDKWEMETLKYHSDWSWQIPAWSKAIQAVKELAIDEKIKHNQYLELLNLYEAAIVLNRPEDGFLVLSKAVEILSS